MREIKLRKYGLCGDLDFLNRCYSNSYVHNRLAESLTNALDTLVSKYDCHAIYIVQKDGRDIGAIAYGVHDSTGTAFYYTLVNPMSCKLSAIDISNIGLLHLLDKYKDDASVIDFAFNTSHQLLANQWLKIVPNIFTVAYALNYISAYIPKKNVDYVQLQKSVAANAILSDYSYQVPTE